MRRKLKRNNRKKHTMNMELCDWSTEKLLLLFYYFLYTFFSPCRCSVPVMHFDCTEGHSLEPGLVSENSSLHHPSTIPPPSLHRPVLLSPFLSRYFAFRIWHETKTNTKGLSGASMEKLNTKKQQEEQSTLNKQIKRTKTERNSPNDKQNGLYWK
jgi:hypothetical protein